jgi:hypothetical protein
VPAPTPVVDQTEKPQDSGKMEVEAVEEKQEREAAVQREQKEEQSNLMNMAASVPRSANATANPKRKVVQAGIQNMMRSDTSSSSSQVKSAPRIRPPPTPTLLNIAYPVSASASSASSKPAVDEQKPVASANNELLNAINEPQTESSDAIWT